jgi:hypothetical protein
MENQMRLAGSLVRVVEGVIMKSKLFGTLAVTAIAALLTCAPANALTFDFSFTSSDGTVTGVISGLTAGTSAATGLTITSYPSALGSLGATPLSAISPNVPTPGFNSFTVTGGEIVFAFYDIEEPSIGSPVFNFVICTSPSPCSPEQDYLYMVPNNGIPATAIADDITFTPVTSSATPLPAALPLFAGGLGAMGLFGWRRKRKTRAVAA